MFGRLLKRPGHLLAVALLLVIAGFGSYLAGMNAWAEYHYHCACRELDSARIASAQEHLQKCLSVWPHSGVTHLLAAQADRRAGSLLAAEEHLEEAQRLLKMTDGVVLERQLLMAQKGDIEPVEDALLIQIEQKPKDAALILEALTKGCLRLDRFAKAVDYAGRWLEIQPNNPAAYVSRGWLWEQVDSNRRAAEDYGRAVELDENDDGTRQKLVGVLLETNQLAEAETHLQKWLQRQPDNPDARFSLARLQFAQGHLEEAAQIMDEVLVQFPGHARVLAERGRIALELHQWNHAETYLRKAIDIQPFDYETNCNLYKCLSGQPDREEAAGKQGERVKQLKDGGERVREIVTQKLREKPEDSALECEVGVILLHAGNIKGGLGWLQLALSHDPNYLPAHKALMGHYELSGDTLQADLHRRILEAAR